MLQKVNLQKQCHSIFSRRTLITCNLILASLFYSNLALAADTKFAVVETRKVIEDSVAHQGILSQVQKKSAEYRDDIQKTEANLKKKYQDLETKKNALSQEVLDKRNEEMNKEVAELQKKSYSKHAALEDAYRNATQKLLDKTTEIIKNQSEQKGYSIVIEKAAVSYSEPSLEITNVILEELNKTVPTVSVDFQVEDNNTDAKESTKTNKDTEVKQNGNVKKTPASNKK